MAGNLFRELLEGRRNHLQSDSGCCKHIKNQSAQTIQGHAILKCWILHRAPIQLLAPVDAFNCLGRINSDSSCWESSGEAFSGASPCSLSSCRMCQICQYPWSMVLLSHQCSSSFIMFHCFIINHHLPSSSFHGQKLSCREAPFHATPWEL